MLRISVIKIQGVGHFGIIEGTFLKWSTMRFSEVHKETRENSLGVPGRTRALGPGGHDEWRWEG